MIKIILPFPPSSNTVYPTARNGRRVKSKKLREWIKNAPSLKEFKAATPCTVSYLIFFPDNRVRDGQSSLKVLLDYLVSEEVIEDDNRRFVKGERWYDGGTDKGNPRVIITIKQVEKEK